MSVWDVIGIAIFGMLAAAILAVYRVHERRIASLTRLLAIRERRQTLQEQSITGLTAGSAGVDRRLARLEAAETVLSERQDAFESQQATERPYQHAIRLVRQGATSRRLVEELELSESEAELIVRLHGSASAAQRAES
jgi:hypothetical protein